MRKWYKLNPLYWLSFYVGLDFYAFHKDEQYAEKLVNLEEKYEAYTDMLLKRGMLKQSSDCQKDEKTGDNLEETKQ